MGDLHRALAVVGAVAVVVTALACSPAGRHANPDTLPFPERMPFGLTSSCEALNRFGAEGWFGAVMPIRARIRIPAVHSPTGGPVILAQGKRGDPRVYGFTFACHRATGHPPFATISFWIRAATGSVRLQLVGESSGGATVQGVFAPRSLTLDSHWRRIHMSGVFPRDRDTVALLVEAKPTASGAAGFVIGDLRISG